MKRIEIISPDGFSIDPFLEPKSKKEAKEMLNEWVKRYERQGYYSTCRNGYKEEIPVASLADECRIVVRNK